MRKSARVSLAGLLACFFLNAAAASACSRSLQADVTATIASPDRLDQKRIDAAVRNELNYFRCKAGLAALEPSPALAKVAATHAKWMARSQKLSHKSTVAGQSTSMTRLKASGVKFRAASENIGQIARYQIDGRAFKIRDAGRCDFTDQSGKTIPAHSYATLARKIVDLWMSSDVHRRNILDARVRKVGSGGGFDKKGAHCGSYYLSQTFAG